MFDKFFALVYGIIGRKKWHVLILVMVLIGASLAGFSFIKFSNNIGALLPSDPDISRSMAFLKDSNLSNKVVISVALDAPDRDKKDLLAAVDQLAGNLRPPLFTKVTVGLSELRMTDDMEFFFKEVPQIFTEDDLAAVGDTINPSGISDKMRKNYLQLMKPEGIFMNSMLRSDPLGLNLVMLKKLKALSSSLGYNVTMESGHFISSDNRHAMIIVQTPVQVTDALGSKELFEGIQKQLKKLPAYVTADIIGGHSHTLSNEKVMKRDIGLTSIVASVFFVLLFLFVFKDISAVMIFLIPLFSIFQAVYICYFFMGGISYSVIGLATVLAGISVDYGVQVYVAARNAKDSPAAAISLIARPVAIGALTTVAVFFSFLFSRIEGYQQLGYLSMLGLGLSLIYCFLFLPHFVSKKTMRLPVGTKLEEVSWSNNAVVGIWLALTLLLLFFSFSVKFDSNIYKIDGTEPSVLQAEKRFQEVWGQDRPAIVVATGKTLEEALEVSDALYREAAKTIGADHFSSLSMLWPSESTRKENLDRWGRFWKQGREMELRRGLEKEGEKYGFARDAFAPFFDNLYSSIIDRNASDNDFIAKLKERFIHKSANGYQVSSYFPDEKKYIDAVSAISKRYPGTFLVSGISMSQRISAVIYSDIVRMTAITTVLVVFLTYLYFRNVKELMMAMVPVVTGIVWLFGLMSLFGIAFNLSTLISAIALNGICVDYGIFMVYRCRYNLKTGIVIAVALSAAATLIGTGVLILADHPALFYVGVTMTIGVLAGYTSSLLVIPQLYRLIMPSKEGTE